MAKNNDAANTVKYSQSDTLMSNMVPPYNTLKRNPNTNKNKSNIGILNIPV